MQEAVNSLVSHIVNSGIRHVIICPGSRNAPLILSFSRHPEVRCYSLIDERSAAYTAVGMALSLGSPSCIVCTSGTATLNLYPAICEAYYSQIPLLVITADRPAELIDQWDGQCIRQEGIFEKHILGSFTFSPEMEGTEINKVISLCSYPKKGPVHLNVPLAEPLYESKNATFRYPKTDIVPTPVDFAPNHLPDEPKYKRILLLAGADALGDRYSENLKRIAESGKVVVLADAVSGLHSCQSVDYWDMISTVADEELKNKLKPELLITMGKFTVSKGLKKFIREFKPDAHWHVTHNHTIADPFETSPLEIESDESIFLDCLHAAIHIERGAYSQDWRLVDEKAKSEMNRLFSAGGFNEFSAVNKLTGLFPENSFLHAGNSMPVRYVSFLAGKLKRVKLYANRGTSGIDGCTSTAAGTSMILDSPVFLLSGDLSFFYDINGLWNKYLKSNFKVIVLNNNGGGIFRLIDGPGDLPEREEYFATSQNLKDRRDCKRLCEEFGLEYYRSDDFVSLQSEFIKLLDNSNSPGLLEIFTDPQSTVEFYRQFKSIKI